MVIKLEQDARRCGWCCSAHVANPVCRCTEDCGSSWCGASVEVGGAHP